jgi:hypothetical protein
VRAGIPEKIHQEVIPIRVNRDLVKAVAKVAIAKENKEREEHVAQTASQVVTVKAVAKVATAKKAKAADAGMIASRGVMVKAVAKVATASAKKAAEKAMKENHLMAPAGMIRDLKEAKSLMEIVRKVVPIKNTNQAKAAVKESLTESQGMKAADTELKKVEKVAVNGLKRNLTPNRIMREDIEAMRADLIAVKAQGHIDLHHRMKEEDTENTTERAIVDVINQKAVVSWASMPAKAVPKSLSILRK